MTCYSPMTIRNKNHDIRKEGSQGNITVPCRLCIGCRIDYARIWGIRICHEQQITQQMGLESSFITLTYDNENLPKDMSLNKGQYSDMTLFLKRLREDGKFRYFQCGEYGKSCKECGKSKDNCSCTEYKEWLGRPHHHMALFGLSFNDKKAYGKSKKGNMQYTSKRLNEKWKKGMCYIGELNFDSAVYAAKYMCKKVIGKGEQFEKRYGVKDKDEYYNGRLPEYVTMSRRPGIGKYWFEKYYKEIYNNDYIVFNGVKMSPFRYYDELLKEKKGESYEKIKDLRSKRIKKRADYLDIKTYQRIGKCKELKQKNTVRLYENG